MSYDLSSLNATNTTTFLDVVTSVNNNSSSAFSVLLLLLVFFGYFFLFKKEDTITDLLVASFLTNIVSTLFLFIGWLSWPIYLTGLFMFVLFLIIFFVVK